MMTAGTPDDDEGGGEDDAITVGSFIRRIEIGLRLHKLPALTDEQRAENEWRVEYPLEGVTIDWLAMSSSFIEAMTDALASRRRRLVEMREEFRAMKDLDVDTSSIETEGKQLRAFVDEVTVALSDERASFARRFAGLSAYGRARFLAIQEAALDHEPWRIRARMAALGGKDGNDCKD